MDRVFRYYDAELGKNTHECILDSDEYKLMLGSIIYDNYVKNLNCTKQQKAILKESIGEVFYEFDVDGKILEDYRDDIDSYLFKHKLYEEI